MGCQVPSRGCEHRCNDGSRCIPYSFVCDGERDCTDGTDERDCGEGCQRPQLLRGRNGCWLWVFGLSFFCPFLFLNLLYFCYRYHHYYCCCFYYYFVAIFHGYLTPLKYAFYFFQTPHNHKHCLLSNNREHKGLIILYYRSVLSKNKILLYLNKVKYKKKYCKNIFFLSIADDFLSQFHKCHSCEITDSKSGLTINWNIINLWILSSPSEDLFFALEAKEPLFVVG